MKRKIKRRNLDDKWSPSSSEKADLAEPDNFWATSEDLKRLLKIAAIEKDIDFNELNGDTFREKFELL